MEDERKLFYVAVTRSKKYLFISRAKDGRDKNISIFFDEAKGSPCMLPYDSNIQYNANHLPDLRKSHAPLTLNFSMLEDYFECPYHFKLSVFYGFIQPLSELMGYGNALHAVVQNINRAVIEGRTITEKLVQEIFEQVFYFPYATARQKERMTESAKRAVDRYVEKLGEVVYAEAPVEIDLGDNITVNGRIDMVKMETIDGVPQTVIVDFKTANRRVQEAISTEQLKIYSLGYQRFTGETADFMEIYHLDSEHTARVPVTPDMAEKVVTEIRQAAENIRMNHLPKKCSKEKCSVCHLSHLCLSKAERRTYTGG